MADVLPIPKQLTDCARNFKSVIAKLDPNEIEINRRLISIIEKLLDQVSPSDMLHYMGGEIYSIQISGTEELIEP